MNRVALTVALAVTATSGIAAISTSAAADPPPESSPPIVAETDDELMSSKEAAFADAAIYSERFGVTIDEALERSKQRQAVEPVLAELETRYAHDYAYAEIDHGATYRVDIHLVGDGGKATDFLAAPGRSQDLPIRVHTGSPFSAIELEEQLATLHTAVVDLGYQSVSSGYDPATGGIEVAIGVQPPIALPKLTTPLEALVPDVVEPSRVTIDYVDGPAATDDDAYGGRLTATSSGGTSGCTTGFTVVSGSTRGIATAGHCDDSRWYNGGGSNTVQMTLQGSDHVGDWGDFQWHTTSLYERDDFYINYSQRRDVTGVQGSMAVNDFVCFFGWISGPDVNCDQVHKLSHTVTTDAGTARRLVVVQGNPSLSGDSGGPWYYNNTAWGINKGRATVNGAQRTMFSRASYIDNALGVYIATS